ncbi:MAG: hypothetical protein WCH40_14360, partial [Verrucomicrobiales bacterium]
MEGFIYEGPALVRKIAGLKAHRILSLPVFRGFSLAFNVRSAVPACGKPFAVLDIPRASRQNARMVAPATFESFSAELSRLTGIFEKNLTHYKKAGYDEASLRQEFLNPLFSALGWDVENKAGHI